jgi:hypothetical protein
LAGFTETGEPDGRHHVVSLKDGRRWTTTPANLGHERDFYRVEDGIADDPAALEEVLAAVEGEIAPAIRRVCESERIPENAADFNLLLNFVALMVARVPRNWSKMEPFLAEVHEKQMRMLAGQGREQFEAMVAEHNADLGARGESPLTYDDLERAVKAVAEGRVRSEQTQNTKILQSVRVVDIILPLLAQRRWSTLVAAPGSEFITSDCPVALHWSDGRQPGFYGPGFGLPETDVTMPISKRMLLLGRYEGASTRREISREQVANLNTRCIAAAERFVCSASPNIAWMRPDQTVGNTDDLVALLQRQRDERISRV